MADGNAKTATTHPDIVRVRVVCEGISPLLLNKMDPNVLLESKKAFKPARQGTPRDRATPKGPTNAKGDPAIPANMILSCLIAAGVFIKLDKKRQVSTAKSTLLTAFMSVDNIEPMPIIVPDSKKAAPWEVDTQVGRNPNGGEAVLLERPRFAAWSFSIHLSIDTSGLGQETIRQLFDFAGSRIGLGDFRPARKGPYGRFIVKCWDRL